MMQFSKNILLAILAVSLTTAATAPAQTISILSGDGQVAPQNFQAGADCPSSTTNKGCMIVVVRNAQGQPQQGVNVTWTVSSGAGSLSQGSTTTTDSGGQTYNMFLRKPLFGSLNYDQSVINASISTGSVNFNQTAAGTDLSTLVSFVQAAVDFPTLADVITGAAGSTATTAIKVRVFAVG